MVVIDTSAWIDYFRGKDTAILKRIDRFLDEDGVLMGNAAFYH